MNRASQGVALALLWTLPCAHAQQAVDRLERIEITGSRIAASDTESVSPIVTIKGEDLKFEGFPFLELVLNTFPQLVGDQGNRISNGATGTATLDLRGIGANRTLVLLNGRRLVAGSPFAPVPDVSQIPSPLVERIEILTGGASAIYGSDAMAGVVNFILKDHFNGVQGEVAYDFYSHRQHNAFMTSLLRAHNYDVPGNKWKDGATTNANLTLGGDFSGGRGNATVFLNYTKSEALLQSERDYSACPLAVADNRQSLFCGGVATSYPGRFLDLASGFSWTVTDASGGVRRWLRANDLYNFAPLNYYQRPTERYGANAVANYELSPNHKVYAELGFHDDHTLAQIAPSGIFFPFFVFSVRYENPLLSDAWRGTLTFVDADGNVARGPGTTALVAIGRRNVEGGGRFDDLRHTSSREVLGLKGMIAGTWDYDAFWQSSRVVMQESYHHDFSIARINRAMDVVTDPSTGAAVCASFLNGSDRTCVPYNIWRLGGVTGEALNYIEAAALGRGATWLHVLGASITGDLGKYGMTVPRSRSPVELALGVERRTEGVEYEPDSEWAAGDLAGTGAPPLKPVNRSITVKEIFGELRVPILDSLKVSGAYRHSGFSSGKSTNTYGVGVNAEPMKAVRLRGSYQQAMRAPSISELYTPQTRGEYGFGNLGAGDPCAGTNPARSLADCRRTGVTAAQYGHIPDIEFGGYPSTIGGNPELDSETAKTYTIGVALMPFRNLSVTLDYFDIRLADTIALNIDAVQVFNLCIETGNPKLCSLITRDPVLGTLWGPGANLVAIAQNVGKTRVSGADIGLSYSTKAPHGHALALDAIGTWLRRWSQEAVPGVPPNECAGAFGKGGACFRPLPKWRHRLRFTWKMPWNLEAAMVWRYIGAVRNGETPSTPDVILTSRLPAMNYFDASVSWRAGKNLTLRAGVSNIGDRDPPLVFGTVAVNGNTFVQVYDPLGRHVFVSATANF